MDNCVRITTSGRSYIKHHHKCAGRFNIFLCLFWCAEEEQKARTEGYCDPDKDEDPGV